MRPGPRETTHHPFSDLLVPFGRNQDIRPGLCRLDRLQTCMEVKITTQIKGIMTDRVAREPNR